MSDQKPDPFAELREAFAVYERADWGSTWRFLPAAHAAMPALLEAAVERDRLRAAFDDERREVERLKSDSISMDIDRANLCARAERAEAEAKALREALRHAMGNCPERDGVGPFKCYECSDARALLAGGK